MSTPSGVDIETILRALYDSEINALISWLWDVGIDVKVGDELNGYEAEGKVSTPFGSEIRLASTTPGSGFARRYCGFV